MVEKELLIKKIPFYNKEDKILKLDYLESLKHEINIYEIIEKEQYLYISIDNNKNATLKIDELIQKLNSQGINKECIIKGMGKYSKLDEIQRLYNIGENLMFQFQIDLGNNMTGYGSGFFFEIDPEMGIPFKKAIFTCHHVLTTKFLLQNNYVEFKYKGEFENIKIKDSIIYSKKYLIMISI